MLQYRLKSPIFASMVGSTTAHFARLHGFHLSVGAHGCTGFHLSAHATLLKLPTKTRASKGESVTGREAESVGERESENVGVGVSERLRTIAD